MLRAGVEGPAWKLRDDEDPGLAVRHQRQRGEAEDCRHPPQEGDGAVSRGCRGLDRKAHATKISYCRGSE
jgi:hypothetical protein